MFRLSINSAMANDSSMEIAMFIRGPLVLSLLSVPGVDDNNNSILGEKGVTNTHQLIGQFLLFHGNDVDAHQLHTRFSMWLRKLGVVTNTTMIACAIAQKVGTWVDGVYEADTDSWDSCSEVGNTPQHELKDRYCNLSSSIV